MVEKNLRFKIKDLRIEKKVVLYGWAENQQKLAELLNKSKILIMPSYNEGGPRVVPEAMACGVPVLATDVGIVPDIVDDEQIIKWDADDIANKSKQILGDSIKYKQISELGIERVKQFEKVSAIKNYADKLIEIIT